MTIHSNNMGRWPWYGLVCGEVAWFGVWGGGMVWCVGRWYGLVCGEVVGCVMLFLSIGVDTD